MGMDEELSKVACDSTSVIKIHSENFVTTKVINLQNFSFEDNLFYCAIIINDNNDLQGLIINKESIRTINFFLDESKQNVTLDDIIKSKITNPKFSRNRKHNQKIIFDPLNLSDKKHFLVQERKDAGG